MTMPDNNTAPADEVETRVGATDPAEAPPENTDEPSYEDVVVERDQLRADLVAAGAGKLAAEAAKHRTKLREAESERDELREHLAAANDVLFKVCAERVGVPPDLMVAAGITAEAASMGVGVLDLDALEEAMEEKRVELSVPRKPQPNPHIGLGAGPTTQSNGKAAWDAAFGVSR